MNKMIQCIVLCLFSIVVDAAEPLSITNAWARATAPGQDVGAAYMTLKSATPAKIIKAEATAAGAVEIHEMSMKDGVMKMRMMETLELPAGKTVALAPGSFHFMLFDLKQPLTAGSTLEMTLMIKDKQGKVSRQSVKVPIKAP